jgi:chromate transporter
VGHGISLGEACGAWIRIAASSFGGPAGQIAVMHKVVVDERKWIGDARFAHALGYCMLLPGPEAHQLVTYLGWLMHGVRGGLLAGGLFVLPGFVSILGLSLAYVYLRDLGPVAGALFGVKAAVLAVVIEAVVRLGKRVLGTGTARAIAVASFAALFFFSVPFPVVVGAAALLGVVGHRVAPASFGVAGGAASRGSRVGSLDAWLDAQPSKASFGRAAATAGIGLVLWFAPVVVCALLLGPDHLLVELGGFFAQAAVVTFGGAYSVLAWVAQAAVVERGWLSAGEMLDGLGLAETTPGPLIQVVQFVGFMAAWHHPGPWSPLVTALVASVLVAWVTFVPSFSWIFVGAPYVERLRANHAWGAALTAVTAAVVGAVLNLGVWLALHVAFGVVDEVVAGPLRLHVPQWGTVDPAAVVIGLVATVLMVGRGAPMLPVLAGGAAAGVVVSLGRGV